MSRRFLVLVIGVGLVFAGYAVGFWAYCGIRGYNVTLPQVFSPKGPPGGQQSKPQKPSTGPVISPSAPTSGGPPGLSSNAMNPNVYTKPRRG